MMRLTRRHAAETRNVQTDARRILRNGTASVAVTINKKLLRFDVHHIIVRGLDVLPNLRGQTIQSEFLVNGLFDARL